MKQDISTGPIATGSVPLCNLQTCTKQQILECMENAYSLDEWLFTSIKDEEFFLKSPDRLRLPLIFYYAHTAVVYVNKLLLAGMIKERVDRHFEGTFEMGVDEMSWDDTENYRIGGAYKWPSLPEIIAYRLKVRELIRKVIQDTPLKLPITTESKWWAMLMSIDHQRMHFETSSVLIRQLPVGMVEKPIGWRYGPLTSDLGVDVKIYRSSETSIFNLEIPIFEQVDVFDQKLQDNPMIQAGNEEVMLGNENKWRMYGWDNEGGCRKLKVPKFEASKFLVTNGEFLKFVQDGGYQKQKFWSEEGWQWIKSTESRHPSFWVCSMGCKSGCGSNLGEYSHCNINVSTGDYRLRLMFDTVPLPHDWPVEVNNLEAKAFCAWKGAGFRLPTEAEHHVMRGKTSFDLTSGEIDACNANMTYGSSTPVGMYPESNNGFCDVFGNAWEWVEDNFNGLSGAKSHYLYVDYSEPFYDGLHTLMMGGSWATTGSQRGHHTRNAFRRHFFQHVGFRVARKLDLADPSPAVYVKTPVYVSGFGERKNEIDVSSAEKLGLKPVMTESFSETICNDTEENLTRLIKRQYFSQSLIKDVLNGRFQRKTERALVIGCGPGSSVFELSNVFEQVIGCDVSARCVDFATKLSEEKIVSYPLNGDESGIPGEKIVKIPEGSQPSKVIFKQLNWVPVELGQFDLILIDDTRRLPNRRAWLAMLPDLIKTPESVIIMNDPDGKAREMWNDIFNATETTINPEFIKIKPSR